MNIREIVSKYLRVDAFTVSPDGRTVLVNYQDDLMFLKNKLKASGLAEIQAYYFDGKRNFSESELKSVMVIGECQDRNLVFSTLEKEHCKCPITKLAYLDPHPSHLRALEHFALEWARLKAVKTKPIAVDFRLGKNAPVIRYSKLFAKRSRTRPDTVVAFTNKEVTPQVKLAQKSGVEVVLA